MVGWGWGVEGVGECARVYIRGWCMSRFGVLGVRMHIDVC